MKEFKIMDGIRNAASQLKSGQLMNLEEIKPCLQSICEKLGFESDEEAMVFVAIFDRQCSDRDSNLSDIADYFDCSSLDAVQFVPAINGLMAKGFVVFRNYKEEQLMSKIFSVSPDVMDAIIEGREVEPLQDLEVVEYDQFDFCSEVDGLKEARYHSKIETHKFFSCVEKKEELHSDMPFVAELRATVDDVESRALFYEMCNDYVENDSRRRRRDVETDIDLTLKAFYEKVKSRLLVKGALIHGTHPLLGADLIKKSSENGIKLTRKGLELLYGEDSEAVLGNYKVESRYEFVSRVSHFVDELPRDVSASDRDDLFENVKLLESENSELSFVSALKTQFSYKPYRMIFYLTCDASVHGYTYSVSDISDFCVGRDCVMQKRMLKDGSHPLIKNGLLEVTGGGHFDGAQLELSDKGKKLFLEEDIELLENNVPDKDLLLPEKIDEKQLFFEKGLGEQLDLLRNSLMEDNYQKLYNRLAENNMPKGVNILFYGKPGTGKTETALQIAKATGRAVMHVDIASTKSCWFGESQKLIKGVFVKYKRLCEKSKIKPILLFNEADGVFSKRKDVNSSNVADTENAIQNIILEEMEKLDGILIATTNLADNLDHAFERRFLFKIKYDNPSIEAKKNIWKDKMPSLSDSDAEQLATAYDFSGGQIDNIVRKSLMEEILKGEKPSLPALMTMCSQEKISGSGRSKIGY
ncbi:MAG: ATP-binding protein [Bacteroidales bacterium]|nr:ATP-binding protein [Bacteroidales bacterium]